MHDLETAFYSRRDRLVIEEYISHLNRSILEVVKRKALKWGRFTAQELEDGRDDMVAFIDRNHPSRARHAIIYWQSTGKVHIGVINFAAILAYERDGYLSQGQWIRAVRSPDHDWYIDNGDQRHSCPTCEGTLYRCSMCNIPNDPNGFY